MRNRTYGGVRGRKTKVGRKLLRFPPTRLENELLPTLGLGECEAIFGVIVDQGYSATTYI